MSARSRFDGKHRHHLCRGPPVKVSSGGSSQVCQIFDDQGEPVVDHSYSLYQGYHLLAVSNSGTVTIANINNLIDGIEGRRCPTGHTQQRVIAAPSHRNVGGHHVDLKVVTMQTTTTILNEANNWGRDAAASAHQIAVAGDQMWLAGLLGTSEGNYTGKFVRRYDIAHIEEPFSPNFAINNVSDTPKALVAVNENTAFLATVTGGQQLKLGAVKFSEPITTPFPLTQ